MVGAAPAADPSAQAQSVVSFLNGRLYQLIGKEAAAVPYLEFAWAELTGSNRASAEQALFAAYINSGRQGQALELAQKAIEEQSPNRPFFEAFLRSVTPAPQSPAPRPKSKKPARTKKHLRLRPSSLLIV